MSFLPSAAAWTAASALVTSIGKSEFRDIIEFVWCSDISDENSILTSSFHSFYSNVLYLTIDLICFE